jgi:hypothetical protein
MLNNQKEKVFSGDNKSMYLTVKALLSAISMMMIAYVCTRVLFFDILLGFMLIISIFLVLFGDLLIGWKLTPFKALFEPTPKGHELMELQLLDGKVQYINTRKGPQGKRSFFINDNEASVINDGASPFRVSGGNIGFRAHELIDRNVDPKRCKALEKMPGENIKELYVLAKQLEAQRYG